METVFAILAVAGLLFASGRVRLDVVALLAVLALMLSGVLTPVEALSGFGSPVVIIVAGLLVIGEMLTRTGLAQGLGLWLVRTAGGSEARMLVLLMATAALLGSVMSSTAVVAMLIPVAMTAAGRTQLAASRLLLPLSYGALISGMLTLIATPPNLVVSAELAQQGHGRFGFFEFTPVGLAVLAVTILYVLGIGRRLLPGEGPSPRRDPMETMDAILAGFGLLERRWRLRVPPGSPLAGRSLAESGLGGRGVRLIGLERPGRLGGHYIATTDPGVELHAGDVLGAFGRAGLRPEDFPPLGLEVLPLTDRDVEDWRREFGLLVVLVHPESSLIGRSVRESGFRSRHRVHVLGLRREGELLDDFEDEPLRGGDAVLVHGPWSRMKSLSASTRELVPLSLPAELREVAPARSRAPAALAIVLGMVLLSASGQVPVVAAVLLAALAAVATGCLSMEDGYRSIHWSSVVLIAGMLPVADALDQTGGAQAIADVLLAGLGEAGPYSMMSLLFFLTAGLGLVLSNTASAVLVIPIAIAAAEALTVSPRPLAMTVAIAASAAFVTPVSTPVVTLVVEPGGYRFLDFVKVGLPLLVLTWLTVLAVVPLVFPF